MELRGDLAAFLYLPDPPVHLDDAGGCGAVIKTRTAALPGENGDSGEFLAAVDNWVESHGLPRGQNAYDYADSVTGAQKALFDLGWPDGLQSGLSAPVVVLLNETTDILGLASAAGFRCFTSSADFRAYIETEILHLEAA